MKLFFKLPVSVNGSKYTYNININGSKYTYNINVNDSKYTYNINGNEATHTFECNHEEADARIVLHASLSSENVVVVVTDMFIILNAHSI